MTKITKIMALVAFTLIWDAAIASYFINFTAIVDGSISQALADGFTATMLVFIPAMTALLFTLTNTLLIKELAND